MKTFCFEYESPAVFSTAITFSIQGIIANILLLNENVLFWIRKSSSFFYTAITFSIQGIIANIHVLLL